MRQNQKRHKRNKAEISELKGKAKKIDRLIGSAEGSEPARAEVLMFISKLDKAASKGIIKKNTASRRKSRLSKRLKKLSA